MEMKREPYSNIVKESEVQTVAQKKKTSVYIKVIVPRRSSAKPNFSPKENANSSNRVKSISTTGTRKSTLESSLPIKEKIVAKTPKDTKGKMIYNSSNNSNIMMPTVQTPFSPGRESGCNQEKRGPLKQTKFCTFSKPKTSSTQPISKRITKTARNELRKKQSIDKDRTISDCEELNTEGNKNTIDAPTEEHKKLSKITQHSSYKGSAGKLVNKKNLVKNSLDILDSKGTMINTKSAERIDTTKQYSKIRTQLGSTKDKPLSKQIVIKPSPLCENYGVTKAITPSSKQQVKTSKNLKEKAWKSGYYQSKVLFKKQEQKHKLLTDSDSKQECKCESPSELYMMHTYSRKEAKANIIPSCLKNNRLKVPKTAKQVTFAEKLIVNENSLDADMIERIKHNLEYNDDRIFEGLSIFELKSDEDQESKLVVAVSNDKTEDQKAIEISNQRSIHGDSGNKDFNDLEHNQGILSCCEESGGIEELKKIDKKGDQIFEAQVSLIQCFDDLKESSCIAKDFDEIDFDKSENIENSSGFMKLKSLNDSLIKNREIWKDKNERRDSYKKSNNNEIDNKKNSDSFLLKEDSAIKEQNASQNMKNQSSFEMGKMFIESGPKSFKNDQNFEQKLDDKEQNEPGFDPEIPSDDFFEEKDSESIIEKNEEDSKFVDEESYSVVYLTKQQVNNNLKNFIKNNNQQAIEGNTKELSRIDDVENSKDLKNLDSIDNENNGNSKEKYQNSMNSISNINSPNFKIDSLIGDSEIKDTKKIINELKSTFPHENISVEANKIDNDNQESDGYLFVDEESKRGKSKTDQSNEKGYHSKDHIRSKADLNSLSEILAEKVDFDMSTIKEMVESLEDDSFHFIQHVHSDLSKHNQNMNSLDEIKQNSFDKIIKYMKKEINKIDKIRKNEKNKDKVQLMIKEFLVNLKCIEVNQANSDEKEEDKTPNTSKQEQNQKQISNNKEQLTNDSLKIMNDYMIED